MHSYAREGRLISQGRLERLLEGEHCVVFFALAQKDVTAKKEVLRLQASLGVLFPYVVDIGASTLDIFSSLPFRGRQTGFHQCIR